MQGGGRCEQLNLIQPLHLSDGPLQHNNMQMFVLFIFFTQKEDAFLPHFPGGLYRDFQFCFIQSWHRPHIYCFCIFCIPLLFSPLTHFYCTPSKWCVLKNCDMNCENVKDAAFKWWKGMRKCKTLLICKPSLIKWQRRKKSFEKICINFPIL